MSDVTPDMIPSRTTRQEPVPPPQTVTKGFGYVSMVADSEGEQPPESATHAS